MYFYLFLLTGVLVCISFLYKLQILQSEQKATLFSKIDVKVFINSSGYEFIKFLCELKKKSKEPDYYLERVAMSEESMNKLICDYNFEEKKRLQLAAFLVQKPYVMLFDEPVDYCSQEFIDTFIDVLEEEKDRHIIIVTTALLDIATHVADDILVLSNGEINEVTKEMLEITEIKHAILDILGEEENDIL